MSSCFYFVRYWTICVLQLYVNQVVTSWRQFWSWPYAYLSSQAIFPAWPKCRDKNFNILRTKRAFKPKWKTFFIIFKGLSIKQMIQNFLEGESPTLWVFLSFASILKKILTLLTEDGCVSGIAREHYPTKISLCRPENSWFVTCII